MIDPRAVAIIVRDKDSWRQKDRTLEVAAYQPLTDRVWLTFPSGKSFPFGWNRVTVLENSAPVVLGENTRLFLDGRARPDVTEAYLFTDTGTARSWWHICERSSRWSVVEQERIQVLPNGVTDARAQDVLDYWNALAKLLPDDNGLLQRNHEKLRFVHPDSALTRILTRGPVEPRPDAEVPQPIYPFHTNVSQSEAVRNALRYPVSVIDGPPGTGKTQAILNIIATAIRDPGATVAVVSNNNSAVDNVYEKLSALGFGFVAANLGNVAKQEEFFETQGVRNQHVRTLLSDVDEPAADPAELAKVSKDLDRLQEDERERARLQHQLHAYRLEQDHFLSFFNQQQLDDSDDLPLSPRYSATKLLDFIAESDPRWARDHGWGRIVDTINRYFKYRALRGVDGRDADVVLKVQRQFYEKKILELEQQIGKITKRLERAQFSKHTDHQQRLSLNLLRTGLRDRYTPHHNTRHERRNYRKNFAQFSRDYPLILSTCHSLQNSIGADTIIDYLIIDEASQTDLITAAPVLAHARHLIVVGDLRQLEPIDRKLPDAPAAPDPSFDYRHSILSALIDRYPDQLPRMMLREHYRCDPDIIEFCNRSFYDGWLIPYTSSTAGISAMTVVRTVPGNHMRRVTRADTQRTERSNEREIDVINAEVLPWVSTEIDSDEIGITTPYRRQADKLTDTLIDELESDTVHKYQGRDKDAIIMTTVLDDTESARKAMGFADDPNLVNVAVSRAKQMFVLVTHHAMLPTSRHLRDLIGYIYYRDPRNALIDSDVVSVFDLLYTDYAKRVRIKPPSEGIILEVLDGLFAESGFEHLTFQRQILLRDELRDNMDRLTNPRHRSFVRNRASFDFVVYNRITNERVGGVEIDGFTYHEADSEQRARDAIKDEICAIYGIPLLRLATTGSNERPRLRRFLNRLI